MIQNNSRPSVVSGQPTQSVTKQTVDRSAPEGPGFEPKPAAQTTVKAGDVLATVAKNVIQTYGSEYKGTIDSVTKDSDGRYSLALSERPDSSARGSVHVVLDVGPGSMDPSVDPASLQVGAKIDLFIDYTRVEMPGNKIVDDKPYQAQILAGHPVVSPELTVDCTQPFVLDGPFDIGNGATEFRADPDKWRTYYNKCVADDSSPAQP